MSAPLPRVDPREVGLSPERLSRLDDHFRRYVDDGRLAGWLVAVARHGRVAHMSSYGSADAARTRDFTEDTVVRLYSMTKPLTSVAAMMLVERGQLALKDPVANFLPEFGESQVFTGGSAESPVLVPQERPMLIWHLLTHTAGLTYGFQQQDPVDEMYRAAGFEWGYPDGFDLDDCCRVWASLPLLFQPGTEWNYSVATDVLGRVVEVVSGRSLDRFFEDEILGPLGMHETSFSVPDERRERLADLFIPDGSTGRAVQAPAVLDRRNPPRVLSGGGGLYGTIDDYLRFCQMILNGGELDGARLLGRHTVSYMARNHLPGDVDLEAYGRPLFSETTYDGIGFGLGFSVVIDAAANKVPCSEGELAWGGAASTAFWIDPAESLSVVFLTQLLPSSTHPIRPELKQLVYQSLIN
ncbi:MAG: class A beta-lactamase-related serine hydrolase [Actinobacteria bacterium]|nr:class A beta-lactamase-related serine hydrolase [Actinomycetota bacterium]